MQGFYDYSHLTLSEALNEAQQVCRKNDEKISYCIMSYKTIYTLKRSMGHQWDLEYRGPFGIMTIVVDSECPEDKIILGNSTGLIMQARVGC